MQTPTPPDWPTRLPLIAILRGIRPDEVLDHASALLDAGFDAIEVPLNSPDWQGSIRALVTTFGERALIGGGTVLQPQQVDELAALGARLMVTPNTRPARIAQAVSRGMTVAAGFATASEAFDALDAGAQALKLFPATTYGPGHVQALRAVLPPVPLFAVGGITPANLADYLRAGCLGAGLGGDLYRPGQAVARTRQQAEAFVAAYRDVTGPEQDSIKPPMRLNLSSPRT
jgi:2-dehydro-3-deoxyphosphogalactonate aldolase